MYINIWILFGIFLTQGSIVYSQDGPIDPTQIIGNNTGLDFDNLNSKLSESKSRVEDIRYLVLKLSVRLANKKIERAQSASEKALNTSKDIVEKTSQKVNQRVSEVNNQLNQWAQDQKNKFEVASDSAREQANNEIDQFVNNTSQQLNDCATSSFGPIGNQFNEIHNTIQSGINAIDNIFGELIKCLDGNEENRIAAIKCGRDIRRSVSEVTGAARRDQSFKVNILRRLSNNILRSSCFIESKSTIEHGQKEIEQRLNDLLNSDLTGDISQT